MGIWNSHFKGLRNPKAYFTVSSLKSEVPRTFYCIFRWILCIHRVDSCYMEKIRLWWSTFKVSFRRKHPLNTLRKSWDWFISGKPWEIVRSSGFILQQLRSSECFEESIVLSSLYGGWLGALMNISEGQRIRGYCSSFSVRHSLLGALNVLVLWQLSTSIFIEGLKQL